MALDGGPLDTGGDRWRDRSPSNHALRHSYDRHLLTSGIPINYLSRWLGHSSIQTTLIYLKLCRTRPGIWLWCRKRYASSFGLSSPFLFR
ncbi:MAG: tyrosine-type recombinase/integrase [Chloroflexi bacterium]|nr:tyrosine-type recombinase/integrase [Chloroflexota bacterium]